MGAQILDIWLPRLLLYDSAYYFQHNYCSFFLIYKNCVSSHAPSVEQYIKMRSTGRSRTKGPVYRTCFVSPFWCPKIWEVASRFFFFGNLWTPAAHDMALISNDLAHHDELLQFLSVV